MESLFILSPNGQSIVEKHFGSRLPRSVCTDFLTMLQATESTNISLTSAHTQTQTQPQRYTHTDLQRGNNTDSIPTALKSNKHVLVHIRRQQVILLAVMKEETSPLWISELLNSIADQCLHYFGSLSDETLRSNFSVVFLLLDEMIDNGIPSLIEPNIVEMFVTPPTVYNRALQIVQGSSRMLTDIAWTIGLSDQKADKLQSQNTFSGIGAGMGHGSGYGVGSGISGCGSDIWWRKGGVSYSGNIAYVDIFEKLKCVVDKNGRVMNAYVFGDIQLNCKLSGIPQCTLSIRNDSDFFDDICFHPCVKIPKFESEGIIQFCPPDGDFTVASYWLTNKHSKFRPPFSVKGSLEFMDNKSCGKLHLVITPSFNTPNSSTDAQGGVALENVSLSVRLPHVTTSISTTVCSAGTVTYQSSNKTAVWAVGGLTTDMGSQKMEITIRHERLGADESPYEIDESRMQSLVPTDCKVVVDAQFSVKGWAISGIKIDSLQITSVKYTPYKGCRCTTSAASVEFRL